MHEFPIKLNFSKYTFLSLSTQQRLWHVEVLNTYLNKWMSNGKPFMDLVGEACNLEELGADETVTSDQ